MANRALWLYWLLMLAVAGCARAEPRVVVYCAQDEEFAVPLFDVFRQRTGLVVAPKFDTEAKKTVGLFAELWNERNRPRCDVFWNNEMLGTMRLRKLGILDSYESPSAAPYPATAKVADHTWHAFAQRARVLLVNTDLVPMAEQPHSYLDLAAPRWRGRAVMAAPLYGTTATHAACLFAVLGSEKAGDYYRALKANDMQLAPGNKQVAEWVGQGRSPAGAAIAVGVTDTDDALAEVKAGRPVAMVFPDQAPYTLFIPNTLGILRGGPNPEGARQLVDYLLSAEIEARLAESESHQFPLNPAVKAELPAAAAVGLKARPMPVNWDKAASLWEETQAFLAKEFTAP